MAVINKVTINDVTYEIQDANALDKETFNTAWEQAQNAMKRLGMSIEDLESMKADKYETITDDELLVYLGLKEG